MAGSPALVESQNNFGFRWLTCVFRVALKTNTVPKQWQTSVLIPIHKKRRQEEVH